MKKYKNLVFDVGSVLIGYRWMDMLIEHGLTPDEANEYGQKLFRNPLWEEFDLELIPFQGVVEKYVKMMPEHEELTRWILGHPEMMPINRPRVWEKIHQLKLQGHKIYLLSNYSSVLFKAHTREATFFDDLDGGIISYEVHVIKPNDAIYQCLFEKYDLNPDECLFFDDKIANVQASIRNGMDAIQVLSEEHLLQELEVIANNE